jgi:hypothetical protein
MVGGFYGGMPQVQVSGLLMVMTVTSLEIEFSVSIQSI